MTGKPQFVFCADDFTGASDTLAALVRHGLRARLYLRPPRPADHPELASLDAIGVATSLRSQRRTDAVAHARGIAHDLAAVNGSFYHLKVCSTFDSSPSVGNIVAIAEAVADEIGAACIAIIGGQPSLGRYCLFGNLFARMDDRTYRIDRHPVMRAHPTTPMDESDLRLHLRCQGAEQIGLVPFTEYRKSPVALAEAMGRRLAEGERTVLFDVSSDEDLAVIGDVLREISREQKILCVGASSVVEALYATPTIPGVAASSKGADRAFDGPIFAFSGSRSSVTEKQIKCAASYKKISITAAILQDARHRESIVQCCQASLVGGTNVLVHLVEDGEAKPSGRTMATMTAGFVTDVIEEIRIGCLVIAGGDTSSAAVERLGIDSISMIADFERGVPIVCAHSRNRLDGLPMVLKGGQMGSPGMFETLVEMAHPGDNAYSNR